MVVNMLVAVMVLLLCANASVYALTAIPDTSWHDFVAECLTIAPIDGLCSSWNKTSTYGTMPNWNTSVVIVHTRAKEV